jgi:hypothetical protein
VGVKIAALFQFKKSADFADIRRWGEWAKNNLTALALST